MNPSDDNTIDLPVDLNTMDDSGLPWAFIDQALHPDRVVPGRHIIVGSGNARAVALVIDVVDGIAHVQPLRGSVASNRKFLAAQPLAS